MTIDHEADREQLIREKAYMLWEEAERPQGSDEEFWMKASRLLHGNSDPAEHITPLPKASEPVTS